MRGPRVLILSAGVGEGHELPARVLAAELRHRAPGAEVEVADGLAAMGRAMTAAGEGGMRATFGLDRMHWVFDLQYLVFARLAPTRALGQWLMHRVSGGRLERFVRERRPDVVVSTHPESGDEVRRIAGPATRIVPVHGLTDPAFLDPPSPEEARRALGLPGAGGVVAVSGGGWGVGDLVGAARAALEVPGVGAVLCLCGRNDALRARLEGELAGEPRVRILGFVERMVDVMAAADVLVHSTAGLTVLEAWMLGCRPISYGWGVGHVRLNNRAFRRFGLADVVASEPELRAAIARALAAPRVVRVDEFARLPAASQVVLELTAAGRESLAARA